MSAAPQSGTVVALSVLMLLTGLGIPVLATLNAGLGQRLASPVAASAVLFAVAFGLSLIALAVAGAPASARFAQAPPVYYAAAVFMVFYVLSITAAAPRIGVGNAVFYVLLGQLVAATAIDHFGLWGAVSTPVTARRLLGVAVMAAGVYLARKPR